MTVSKPSLTFCSSSQWRTLVVKIPRGVRCLLLILRRGGKEGARGARSLRRDPRG